MKIQPILHDPSPETERSRKLRGRGGKWIAATDYGGCGGRWGQRPHVRRLQEIGITADATRRAKKQLIHRLPPDFVRRILKDFNSGALDAPSAAARLGVSRARLYQLRTHYLKDKPGYQPKASGGDRREDWPAAVVAFLKSFLPVQSPPNYQLVADEMERLCSFKRSRATVESHVTPPFPIWFPRLRPRSAPTGVSAALTSANSGSTTARSTSGGPLLTSKPCCSPSMTVRACMSRAASSSATPLGITSSISAKRSNAMACPRRSIRTR